MEASGDTFLAANAKSYVLFDSKNPSATKLSCAGVSRNKFNNLHIDTGGDLEQNECINANLYSIMEKVIFDLKEHEVQNRNITRLNGSCWTNISMRRGFSPLFSKRRIDSDGYHTTNFDVVLKPRDNLSN